MYQTAQPPNHLKKYIDFFWMGEQESNDGKLFAHHAIASTKLELQFHYVGNYVTSGLNGQNERVFKAGFFGQSDTYKHYFAASQKTSIFSVRFHPLALITLFNVPACELTNQSSDITSVIGKRGNELAEQIFEAKSFTERIAVVIQFIEAKNQNRLRKYSYFEKILTLIYQSNRQIHVADLATLTFLSQRQFQRNFKDFTGFSAKTYLKIVRFEHLVDAVAYSQKITTNNFTDIALNFGYYDQAHFNRHCKDFTGITPSAYFDSLTLQDL